LLGDSLAESVYISASFSTSPFVKQLSNSEFCFSTMVFISALDNLEEVCLQELKNNADGSINRPISKLHKDSLGAGGTTSPNRRSL
jgi:hypothetical protein